MTRETIDAWVKFCYNHPHDWLQQCWSDDPSMRDHLYDKYISYIQRRGTTATAITDLWNALDYRNQTKMVNWINENYAI